MAAVVDTNVLLDFRDEDSDRHDRAQRIVHGVDSGDLPTCHVTDVVVLETMNWLHERRRNDLAMDTYRRLTESSGFEIHESPTATFSRAVDCFDRYQGLSFGDASIAAYMDRTGIEYLYSFDDDFDAVDWITRLETASNPYR